jgi:hypothetical protein
MTRPARPRPAPGGVKPLADGGVDAGGLPAATWLPAKPRSPRPSPRPRGAEPLARDLEPLLRLAEAPWAVPRRVLVWPAAAARRPLAVPGAPLVPWCPSVRPGAVVIVRGDGPRAPPEVCRMRATAPTVDVAMTAPTASAFAASAIEAVFPDTAAATVPLVPAWAEPPPISRVSIPMAAAAGSAGATARSSAPRSGIALANAAHLSHSCTCARTRRP